MTDLELRRELELADLLCDVGREALADLRARHVGDDWPYAAREDAS